jgi:8-oxo-dGTP diphosphatase
VAATDGPSKGEDRGVPGDRGTAGPPFCYDYPRPAVTVDLAIFALSGDGLRVLLIRRKHDPFAGRWALPGGFLEIDEAIEDGARRELKEETGFDATGPISFLGAYGDPSRDPRGRTISLAHAAVIRGIPPDVSGGDDAAEAAWRLARSGSAALAFDHDAILAQALRWLGEGVRSGNLGLDLLPEEFDETEVRRMFRSLFDTTAGASQWLRRKERAGLIEPRAGSGRLYQVVKTGLVT